MELWDQQIVSIQKDFFLATPYIILIEPHMGNREMLLHMFRLWEHQYHILPISFAEAEVWLEERESQQKYASTFLFDCFHERDTVDHFLEKIHERQVSLARSIKTIGITLNEIACGTHIHDHVLIRPFKHQALRTYLLT